MARDEVSFQLQLYRSTDSSLEENLLRLSTLPETVEELKAAVEDHYSIPRCLQTLSIGDREIKTGDDPADLRSGDVIKVTYLCDVPMKQIKQLTECVQKVKELARSTSKLDNDLIEECNEFLFGIRDKILYPWLSDTATASRMCLEQLGGVDAVLSLLELLQTNFPWAERSREGQNLEEMLLAFLQNFAETPKSQEPVVRRGGFKLMLTALMRVDVTSKLSPDTAEFFCKAVGCVSK